MKSSSRSGSSITCTGSLTKHKRRNFHVMRNPLRMHCYANKQFFFLFLSCTSSCSNFYSFVFFAFSRFPYKYHHFLFYFDFYGNRARRTQALFFKTLFTHRKRKTQSNDSSKLLFLFSCWNTMFPLKYIIIFEIFNFSPFTFQFERSKKVPSIKLLDENERI